MNTLIFISILLLPFIFNIIFIFLNFHQKTFKIYTLLFTTIFSFLAIIISSFLQLFLSHLFSQFLKQESFLTLLFNSFIYSGAIEEITKFLFFYCVLIFFVPSHIKERALMQIYDKKSRKKLLILVMFFASCFAGFENIAYIVLNIKLLPIRLITATIFHILIAPYYLKAISKEKSICLSFLMRPILLHGTYNIFMMIGGVFFSLSFVIIFFLLIKTKNYLS
ncbi:MAG: PrsW family glutamic-type intramembrane protease [Treponema sp.]